MMGKVQWCSKCLAFILLSASCLLSSVTAYAERWALIVGVSEYPYLDNLNLEGPKNDADLAVQTLLGFGFSRERIQLLSNGEKADAAPTRQRILAGLATIAEQAQGDDFVYLHFAGHGSQQPANADDELDGLDEIFLPMDSKGWSFEIGSVENAITDNEFHEALQKIRKTGAFVWGVFDNCHSGTITRSSNVLRSVPPHALGVPDNTLIASASHAGRELGSAGNLPSAEPPAPVEVTIREDSDERLGDYVFFYAAQPDEQTPERSFPRRGKNKKVFGMFSYLLFQSIHQFPNASYQQLAEQIMYEYQALPWRRSTPLFSGSNMSARLFNQSSDKKAQPQWPLLKQGDYPVINAGAVHGLERGARLAILSEPGQPTELALGFAEVERLQPTHSSLRFIEVTENNKHFPALNMHNLPKRSYVRLLHVPQSFAVKVAIADGAKEVLVNSVRERLAFLPDHSLTLNWQPGIAADIVLFPAADKIWLLTQEQAEACVEVACNTTENERRFAAVALDVSAQQFTNDMGIALETMSRALNLQRVGAMAQTEHIDVALVVKAVNAPEKVEYGSTQVPSLHEGDQVYLSLHNKSSEYQDITVLMIDSKFGITRVFPRNMDDNRFGPGFARELPIGRVNTRSIGRESLLVIATTADKRSPPSDLGYLEQVALPDEVTRGGSGSVTQLFSQIGGGALRSSSHGKGGMKMVSWETSGR